MATRRTSSPPDAAPPAPADVHKPGPIERIILANDFYRGLQKRARSNSWSWWGLRIVQAVLFVIGLVILDLLLLLLLLLVGHQDAWSRFQIPFVLVGGFALLRNGLAPLNNQLRFPLPAAKDDHVEKKERGFVQRTLLGLVSCRWTVIVPETWYSALENGDEFTQRFLGPGYHNLRWRPGWKVVRHTDNYFFRVEVAIENVLNMLQFPVKVEVSANLMLNPTNADQGMEGTLRRQLSRDAIEGLLKKTVRDTVVQFVNGTLNEDPETDLASTTAGVGQISRPKPLVAVIRQRLNNLNKMGLFLVPDNPPTVHISYPENSELYEQLRLVRTREDIERIIDRFGLSVEQVRQLLGLTWGHYSSSYSRTGRRTSRRYYGGYRAGGGIIGGEGLLDRAEQRARQNQDKSQEAPPPVEEEIPASEPLPEDDPWADIMAFLGNQNPPSPSPVRGRKDDGSGGTNGKKRSSRHNLSRPLDDD